MNIRILLISLVCWSRADLHDDTLDEDTIAMQNFAVVHDDDIVMDAYDAEAKADSADDVVGFLQTIIAEIDEDGKVITSYIPETQLSLEEETDWDDTADVEEFHEE